MEALFLQIVKLSIAASFFVLVAVVLRLVFRRAPKWLPCALWALVGVRLVLPVTVHSRVSVVPDPDVITARVRPAVYTAAVRVETALPAAAPVRVTQVLAWIWLAGVCAMLLYFLMSSAALHRRVRGSSIYSKGVRVSEWAQTPFVFGVLRPVIYLPAQLVGDDLPYILAHEHTHIRRGDHIWKPLGFILLSIYWFNPVLWLAYVLLCRDIEAACDERVIREMSIEGRRAYSGALLNCAVHRRVISACPIAFGEVGVKARIKSVMNYRKPAFWIILLAVLASVIAAVCLLTTKRAPETPNVERPMLQMDGKYYVDPYMPESTLPAGYAYAGELTEKQANNTGLMGVEYYVSSDSFDFYTYQLCGTPTGLDEVDSENRQMAYLRWIPADFDAIAERRLTMDAVKLLAQKGNALTWADFDRYYYAPTGYHFEAFGDAPAVIRTYPIDKIYEVVIGGSSTESAPQYIILRNRDVNAWVDMRTKNVEEFVAAYQPSEIGGEAADEKPGEPEMSTQLVLVNGILYENTGRESTMDARCGTMDGAIESTVEAGQMPTEERQSNFGAGYEFQYVTNEEIDVVIGGKWMVFQSTEPFPREYYCQSTALEPYSPYLNLSNGWFEFCVSPQNDKTYWGRYTLKNDILTLNALDGEYFTFDRTENTFVFRADASTPLPPFSYAEGAEPQPPFLDGAVFAPPQ